MADRGRFVMDFLREELFEKYVHIYNQRIAPYARTLT
jgi:hypothetical protein